MGVMTQTATRQQLLDYFDNTWTLTEVLFSGLQVFTCLQMFFWTIRLSCSAHECQCPDFTDALFG